MNHWFLLPLTAFSTNLIMFFYTFFKGIELKLNRYFCLFTLSLSLWALGDLIAFISTSSSVALLWNHLTLVGACFTTVFLLHFFLIFTKNELILKKKYISFLYLPAFIFISISFSTNWISVSAEASWWGFNFVRGLLYLPYSLYLSAYVIIGLILCFKHYSLTTSLNEKIQIKFIVIAVSIPLVGGIITQIIPVIVGVDIIPMTSILTTITAIIIAYAILKHDLMATRFFSIYRKLVTSFLIVLILVSLIGIFSLVQSRDLLEKNIGNRSVESVIETMNNIDDILNIRIEELKIQVDSHNYGFHNLIEKSNQEFDLIGFEQEIYNYIMEKDEEWITTSNNFSIHFIEELLNNNISIRLNEKLIFYNNKYNYNLFGEIFLTNKYGAIIGLTGITSDYYQADEDWWIKGKETGLYIGDVAYDESSDIYSIDIILRIDDENGNFMGILKAVWNIEEIINLLENSRIVTSQDSYETLCCYLLDGNGRLIFSTKEFEFFDNKSHWLSYFYINNETSSYYILNEKEYSEKEKLIAVAHSSGFEKYSDLNLMLVMDYDTDDIFAPISNLRNMIIIATIIITLIGLFIGYFISRTISNPIIELSNVSKEIGKGNLEADINIYSNDEIGNLSKAFRNMINDLKKSRNEIQKYNENLEKIVDERTNKLRESENKLKLYVEKLERNKLALTNIMSDMKKTMEARELAEKDLKKSHILLRKLNDELEQKVHERTKDIQLLLKQKDEFINQLGHDLKNPLGPLINLLPILEMKSVKDEDKEIIRALNRNVGYMKNLVSKTLELGRLNSSNSNLNIESFPINEELTNIIENNRYLINEKNINVINNISDDIIINADKLRITELFNNLINNSVKYSNGNDTITFNVEDKGDEILLSITDTGIGMTKRQLENIFNEFYKADESRHDFDSSGLGLSIAKSIVEKHGGRIWAESEGIGKGSTIYFTIPLYENKN